MAALEYQPDPVSEKKRMMLVNMIWHEINVMTEHQLATAILIARIAKKDDPRVQALIEDQEL